MSNLEYIPFEEWNKIQDEAEKTWKKSEKKYKFKNPKRVTNFARKR